jgi:hypothetical protein
MPTTNDHNSRTTLTAAKICHLVHQSEAGSQEWHQKGMAKSPNTQPDQPKTNPKEYYYANGTDQET